MIDESRQAGPAKVRQFLPEDYPAAKEVIAQSFEAHLKQNPGALAEYEREPWYDPEHLFVAEVDGRVVSQMGVRDGALWIAGNAVPAGLVGTVCTLPEYRGRGIGADMMRAACDWMQARGLAMSYLHTSEARHGFYGRLGYRLSVIEHPKAVFYRGEVPAGARVRKAGPADAVVCNAIYEAHFGRLSGGWSRSEAFWRRRLEGKPKLWFLGRPEVYLAGRPEPAAYAVLVREPGPRIVEVAAFPGAGTALRGLLVELFRGLEMDEVEVAVGPKDPLWKDLQDFQPEARVERGNVFVRVENTDVFLAQAASVLGRRALWQGLTCAIRFDGAERDLRVGEGEVGLNVRVASVHDLCALVYNGACLDAKLREKAVEVLNGSLKAMRRLFPDTHPSRRQMDGY